MSELTPQDQDLIRAAREIIALRYREGWHEIGAALRTRSGRLFSAVHLEANVGRIAVCAEAVAIGMAASAGDTAIDTIVAVDPSGSVVAPCGMCRELISDYAPGAAVIVPGAAGLERVPVLDLLPNKYTREESSGDRAC